MQIWYRFRLVSDSGVDQNVALYSKPEGIACTLPKRFLRFSSANNAIIVITEPAARRPYHAALLSAMFVFIFGDRTLRSRRTGDAKTSDRNQR